MGWDGTKLTSYNLFQEIMSYKALTEKFQVNGLDLDMIKHVFFRPS